MKNHIKKESDSVTLDLNLMEVDFLDVTFHLKRKTHRLYRKLNSDFIYVNISTEPPKKRRYILKKFFFTQKVWKRILAKNFGFILSI